MGDGMLMASICRLGCRNILHQPDASMKVMVYKVRALHCRHLKGQQGGLTEVKDV